MRHRCQALALLIGLAGCFEPEPPPPVGAGDVELATTPPWRWYMCNMYEPASWARSVRGAGSPATRSEGFQLLDRTGTLVQSRLDDLTRQVQARLDATGDLVLSNGGIQSAKDGTADEFIGFVDGDGGAAWRAVLRAQFRAIDGLGQGDRVIWQIGNEINSTCHYEAYRRHAAHEPPLEPRECADENLDFGIRDANMDEAIEPFVELDLAPTIQAHREVGSKSRVMLGSIANAGNAGSRAWLDKLLAQPIKGTYAPALRGKGLRVRDVVDIVSYHYVVTKLGEAAPPALDELFALRGQGRVAGIWATEELGGKRARSGRGAAETVRVWAQYQDWWRLNDIVAASSRVCIFAANVGNQDLPPDPSDATSGHYGLGLIDALVPGLPLTRAYGVGWTTSSPTNLYAFTADGPRWVLVAAPPVVGAVPTPLRSIELGARGAGAAATVHVLSPRGDRVLTTRADASGRLRLGTLDVVVDPAEVVLVLVDGR